MPKYKGVQKKRNKFYGYINYQGKRYWSGSFKTAEEAHAWRIKTKNALLTNTYVAKSNTTVSEFIIQYLSEYAKPRLRSSTYKTNESLLRLYIVPTLGNIKLQTLTPFHVQKLQNHLLQETSSINTYNIMRIFRQVLNIAVKWDIISNNPSLKINLPKLQKKEQAILTPEELSVLLMSSNDRDKSIIALAALAGLRRGEIFGLQWDDIDIKNNKIFLRRQYHNGEIKSLKTDKSQIILPTMKKLSLMLAEWKLQSGSHLWVYAGKNNKPLYPDTWVAKIFKKLLQENDLPQIRFHDLRHTFVSLLISKGVSTPDVQRLARHSSYQTTIDIYRHLLPNQLESILEELNDSIAIRRTKRRTVQ